MKRSDALSTNVENSWFVKKKVFIHERQVGARERKTDMKVEREQEKERLRD